MLNENCNSEKTLFRTNLVVVVRSFGRLSKFRAGFFNYLVVFLVETVHLYREVASKVDSLLQCGLPFGSQRRIYMLQFLS